MPVYLFTYHAYRSWMPDREEGFVQRGEGVQPKNQALSNIYRQQANEDQLDFSEETQKKLIDEVLIAGKHQGFDAHFIATDSTHVHVLVSWKTDRTWKQLRNRLKTSISIRLNRELGRRTSLSEGASRKQVKDQSHFDRLVRQYLPKHRGWKWQAGRGLFK
jgi:REP element-mobilizing transposase RayT